MKPNRKIDTLNAGELIQQLQARKITPKRFSVDTTQEKLSELLYGAYSVEVRARGKEVQLDEDTRRHIEMAAQWLSDPNGKIGLMMTGLYGNGKTTLMMAICNLINFLFDSETASNRKRVKVMKAKEIARMAVSADSRTSYEGLFAEDMLAIDEVGEEPAEVISYGMTYTPIRDLLEERYARRKFTIIATNLVESRQKNLLQITDHYGARVTDRIREMMKIIPFHNESYRKN